MRASSRLPCLASSRARLVVARSSQRQAGTRRGDKIILAEALKNEEGCRAIPTVGDQVRTAWSDRIGITWAEPHLLFWFP